MRTSVLHASFDFAQKKYLPALRQIYGNLCLTHIWIEASRALRGHVPLTSWRATRPASIKWQRPQRMDESEYGATKTLHMYGMLKARSRAVMYKQLLRQPRMVVVPCPPKADQPAMPTQTLIDAN
jgi:hypothetical protein